MPLLLPPTDNPPVDSKLVPVAAVAEVVDVAVAEVVDVAALPALRRQMPVQRKPFPTAKLELRLPLEQPRVPVVALAAVVAEAVAPPTAAR